MTLRNDLLGNIREFLREANKAKDGKAFNSAVTLLFKAIAVTADLFLLEREGEIPSNHAERFRILQAKYFEVYKILDKTFPIYQQSYKTKMSKEYVNEIENEFKKLIKFTEISI